MVNNMKQRITCPFCMERTLSSALGFSYDCHSCGSGFFFDGGCIDQPTFIHFYRQMRFGYSIRKIESLLPITWCHTYEIPYWDDDWNIRRERNE